MKRNFGVIVYIILLYYRVSVEQLLVSKNKLNFFFQSYKKLRNDVNSV